MWYAKINKQNYIKSYQEQIQQVYNNETKLFDEDIFKKYFMHFVIYASISIIYEIFVYFIFDLFTMRQ